MDLTQLTPTQVTRDLRSKTVTIFGQPKVGKTTISSQFPGAILAATEVGYRALSGVYAQDITRWTDFTKFLRQLDRPEVKEKFSTVVIDVVDHLWTMCEKFVVNGAGVEKLSDVPYGALYKILADTFSEAIRSIPQKGYGVVFLTHSVSKQFTDENGVEYNKIVPTLNDRCSGIILGASDIVGYAQAVEQEGEVRTALFLRGTPRFVAGSRFKHTPDVIPFEYDALVNAIADAIEKEAEEKGKDAVTDEEVNYYKEEDLKPFEAIKEEINDTIATIMKDKDEEERNAEASKIKSIVETHLGKNKRVADTTEDQRDHIELVLIDLQDYLASQQQ